MFRIGRRLKEVKQWNMISSGMKKKQQKLKH